MYISLQNKQTICLNIHPKTFPTFDIKHFAICEVIIASHTFTSLQYTIHGRF